MLLLFSAILQHLQDFTEVTVVFPKKLFNDYQDSHSETMMDVVFLARFSSMKNQNGLSQKGPQIKSNSTLPCHAKECLSLDQAAQSLKENKDLQS